MSVRFETFRKIGLAQCHTWQRFGHGSSNCNHSPRCVKCAGDHFAKDCPKTSDQAPTCVNCGENHTSKYRGCEWYYLQIRPTKNQGRKPCQNTRQNYQQIILNNKIFNQTNPTHTSQQNNQYHKNPPPPKSYRSQHSAHPFNWITSNTPNHRKL